MTVSGSTVAPQVACRPACAGTKIPTPCPGAVTVMPPPVAVVSVTVVPSGCSIVIDALANATGAPVESRTTNGIGTCDPTGCVTASAP